MTPIKRRCPLCHGTGGDPFNNTCHHCRGEGYVNPGVDDIVWWLFLCAAGLLILWLLTGAYTAWRWENALPPTL